MLDRPVSSGTVQGRYDLDAQIGFVLRRAHQRATAIFTGYFKEANLSPVQFAALIKVRDEGQVSQNKLGRLISIDPATIMGVISRLVDRGLICRLPDPVDRRRTMLSITPASLQLLKSCESIGLEVSRVTLNNLSPDEQETLRNLLAKIV